MKLVLSLVALLVVALPACKELGCKRDHAVEAQVVAPADMVVVHDEPAA